MYLPFALFISIVLQWKPRLLNISWFFMRSWILVHYLCIFHFNPHSEISSYLYESRHDSRKQSDNIDTLLFIYRSLLNHFRLTPLVVYLSLFVLLSGVYLYLSRVYGYSFPNGFLVRDPFLLLGSVLGTIGVLYAAIQSANEKWFISASWLIFSFAYLLDNLSTTLQVFFRTAPMGHLPYILIMISYSLITIGIVLLPSSSRPNKSRPKSAIDIMIFIFVTLAATWGFLIIPFVYFNYPLFDQIFTALTFLLIFSVFDLLLRRRRCSSKRTSYLLCISIAATLVGEIMIAMQRPGAPLWVNICMNLCWLASYAAVGMAGLSVEFLNQSVEEKNTYSRFEQGFDFCFQPGGLDWPLDF